jgi:hypothetical protein
LAKSSAAALRGLDARSLKREGRDHERVFGER